MSRARLYRIEGVEYTKVQIGKRLGITPSVAAKRMAKTPQPWLWANLNRAGYRTPMKLYRVDGKDYTIHQIAAELGTTVHAARARLYERLEQSGKLQWVSLRINQKGRTKLRRVLTNHPAAQYIRDKLTEQHKTVAMLSRMLGYSESTHILKLSMGKIILTPAMASRVADALMLTDEEETRLHLLGAIQAGWKLSKNMVQRTHD